MSHDALQSSLHAAALSGPAATLLARAAASWALIALAAAFGALLLRRRGTLTWGLAARVAASGVLAVVVTQLLVRGVQDPRPYIAEHYAPLTHVSADNGFPSDHTLVAALLCGWSFWTARRWTPLFAVGVAAVAAGRLAVGAHHTLDILGSLAVAGASVLVVGRWHPGAPWAQRRILADRAVTTPT